MASASWIMVHKKALLQGYIFLHKELLVEAHNLVNHHPNTAATRKDESFMLSGTEMATNIMKVKITSRSQLLHQVQ